jgi:hypothetical protein
MAPRFHTRDAALFLSKHHSAVLSLLSHTLSIESYYFAKNKVYSTENDLEIRSLNKTTEIVDIKSERRGGNYSLVSIDMLNEFKKTKTGDVVFFINRRGTSSYVGCNDCGNVLKCPNCKLSLTHHQDKNILKCHYCKFSEPMPIICKKCRGVNVAAHGGGTQLAEELRKKIIKLGDRLDYDATASPREADTEISLDDVSENLFEDIQTLQPFGQINPSPVFLIKNVFIRDLKKVSSNGDHIKMRLSKNEFFGGYDRSSVGAIYFRAGENGFKAGDKIDVLAELQENIWNERRNIELRIVDAVKTE